MISGWDPRDFRVAYLPASFLQLNIVFLQLSVRRMQLAIRDIAIRDCSDMMQSNGRNDYSFRFADLAERKKTDE